MMFLSNITNSVDEHLQQVSTYEMNSGSSQGVSSLCLCDLLLSPLQTTFRAKKTSSLR